MPGVMQPPACAVTLVWVADGFGLVALVRERQFGACGRGMVVGMARDVPWPVVTGRLSARAA